MYGPPWDGEKRILVYMELDEAKKLYEALQNHAVGPQEDALADALRDVVK